MGIYTPIRLDRLQAALVGLFTAALDLQPGPPLVFWALTEPTHEQIPVNAVAVRMISPPSPFIRKKARGTLLNPSDSIDITVASVVVGARYMINLNGFGYFHDASGVDTVTTIRDSLRSQIEADLAEPVTASDVGGDTVRLAANFNGAMRTLQIFGSLTSSANVVSDDSVLVTKGSNIMLVNVQAYSKSTEPFDGAPNLTAICFAALQSRSRIEALYQSGVAVRTKGVPTDLSAVVGGRWESRSSFDLTLAMHAAFVEDVERIESVALTSTFSGVTTEQTISA